MKQEQTNDFNSEIDILLAGGKALLNNHLVSVRKLIDGEANEAIDDYVAQGLLVESLVLAKAYGNKVTFKNVLQAGFEIFKKTNDR